MADLLLQLPLVWSMARPASTGADTRMATSLAGIALPTPLGAAAGIDKDCRFLGTLLDLGFGFATGGTVTLSARPGNPRPRLIREARRRAVINAMGFPGSGLEAAEVRMQRYSQVSGRLFISVSGTIEEEIIECHRRLERFVAAVEINISSPNTSGLRIFHEPARLNALVGALSKQKTRPVFVKLPPWPKEAEARRDALHLAETAVFAGADGLVVANSHPIEDTRLKVGRGGLSGAPIFQQTVRMVAETRAALPASSIIACGGVSSARDAWELLSKGANAVQLYTALVFEGPGLPSRINQDLNRMIAKAGLSSVSEISGAPPV